MSRPDLKTTFNTVASLYDEVRPGYPDELVRDVLDLSEMDRSGKILEVGCGTGQASRLFAILGCEMTCLDIGQDLIEAARARLNNYKTDDIRVPRIRNYRFCRPYPPSVRVDSELFCGTVHQTHRHLF